MTFFKGKDRKQEKDGPKVVTKMFDIHRHFSQTTMFSNRWITCQINKNSMQQELLQRIQTRLEANPKAAYFLKCQVRMTKLEEVNRKDEKKLDIFIKTCSI